MGLKSCEIKDGGHEMATMMLMVWSILVYVKLTLKHINVYTIAAISWPIPKH